MPHSTSKNSRRTSPPTLRRLFTQIKQSATGIQATVIILGLNIASLFSPAWDLFYSRINQYLNWQVMMLSPDSALQEAERVADELISNPAMLEGIQQLMTQVLLIHVLYILMVWGILWIITQSFKRLLKQF